MRKHDYKQCYISGEKGLKLKRIALNITSWKYDHVYHVKTWYHVG